MICKLNKGKGFRGLVSYLLNGSGNRHPERGELIATNMAGITPRELAAEFATIRQLRPTLGKAIAHVSISLSPDDRTLTNQEFTDIAKAYLDRMDFGDAPYLVYRHSDTEHSHIHVVASRIRQDGSVVSDKQDYARSETIMRELEAEYRLKKVIPSTQAARKSQTRKEIQLTKKGATPMKKQISDLLDEAINNSHDITDFLTQCEKLGILVCPHIQNGKVRGLIYKFRKAKMKASDLGKKYQWENLIQVVPYTDVDMIALNKRKRAEEENNFEVTLPEDVPTAYLREYRRMILGDEYTKMLAKLFGQDLIDAKKKGDNLEIELTHGKIIDTGVSISSENMDAKMSAMHLIKLAQAKGWESIVLNGNNDFVRYAMQEAIQIGLPVTLKDDKQKMLMEEAKAALAISRRQNTSPEIKEDQSGSHLPKLNPLKVGEWANYQNKKNKKDDETEKRRKKFKYGG